MFSQAVIARTPVETQKPAIKSQIFSMPSTYYYRDTLPALSGKQANPLTVYNTTSATLRIFQGPSNPADQNKPISSYVILHNTSTGQVVHWAFANGGFYNQPVNLTPGNYIVFLDNKSDFPIDMDVYVF